MDTNILVIDDDNAILDVITFILEDKGYMVTAISDSNLVESYLLSHTPSMVLVDFWMAGLNGKKIVAMMQDNPQTSHVPVIMISANHDVEKIAKEIHASDFLAKPFDIADLLGKVEKYLPTNTDMP